MGNTISYQGEVDVGGKTAKFLRVTGPINRTLRSSKVRKETRLKVYTVQYPSNSNDDVWKRGMGTEEI